MSTGWKSQALCRDVDTDLFLDTDDTTAIGQRRIAMVKRWCADCPVQPICLEYAMGLEKAAPSHYRAGIYGGLTPRERSGLYKRRVRQRAAAQQAEVAA